MPDREKIESLKQCLSASCRGFRICPYSTTEWDAIETVLELLAEQEPVKPGESAGIWFCGNCGGTVYQPNRFCPYCGRRIAWDAAD